MVKSDHEEEEEQLSLEELARELAQRKSEHDSDVDDNGKSDPFEFSDTEWSRTIISRFGDKNQQGAMHVVAGGPNNETLVVFAKLWRSHGDLKVVPITHKNKVTLSMEEAIFLTSKAGAEMLRRQLLESIKLEKIRAQKRKEVREVNKKNAAANGDDWEMIPKRAPKRPKSMERTGYYRPIKQKKSSMYYGDEL